MDQPTADRALDALRPLAGEWLIEVAGPDGQLWPGTSRATFEWLPSRAHLVQRTTIDLPEAPDSTSVIGCDGAAGTYVQLYSDERGVSRIYMMTMDGRRWTLHRDGEPFPQRFVAEISADGATISGRWEKDTDGSGFTLDFTMIYRKQEPGGG